MLYGTWTQKTNSRLAVIYPFVNRYLNHLKIQMSIGKLLNRLNSGVLPSNDLLAFTLSIVNAPVAPQQLVEKYPPGHRNVERRYFPKHWNAHEKIAFLLDERSHP